MKRSDAVGLLRQYWDKPVFNVKIGVSSPQVKDVDFETALAEFDRCDKFSTEYMEYVYIYASEFCKDEEKLDDALRLFNLGAGRHKLNQEGLFT